MRLLGQNEPLTEAELDRLGEFLKNCQSGKAMTIEELDGFFAALVAGLEVVMPSEYLPQVFGGEMSDAHELQSLEEVSGIMALLMRHWNGIAATLAKDEPYLPVLLEDENGVKRGNDWARGFMRGVEMRHDGWAELLRDDDHAGCMIPFLILYHEHDKDPAMRPDPIGPEQREKIIAHMAAGLLQAYRYFRQDPQPHVGAAPPETRPADRKIGRNDPCPSGLLTTPQAAGGFYGVVPGWFSAPSASFHLLPRI